MVKGRHGKYCPGLFHTAYISSIGKPVCGDYNDCIGPRQAFSKGYFPSVEELEELKPEEVRELLLGLPCIGDYSADIINPHGGFPIDVWSVDVFSMLFYGREPKNARDAVAKIKRAGIKRWGKWAWMAFYYVAQDLENLSKKLGVKLRLE